MFEFNVDNKIQEKDFSTFLCNEAMEIVLLYKKTHYDIIYQEKKIKNLMGFYEIYINKEESLRILTPGLIKCKNKGEIKTSRINSNNSLKIEEKKEDKKNEYNNIIMDIETPGNNNKTDINKTQGVNESLGKYQIYGKNNKSTINETATMIDNVEMNKTQTGEIERKNETIGNTELEKKALHKISESNINKPNVNSNQNYANNIKNEQKSSNQSNFKEVQYVPEEMKTHTPMNHNSNNHIKKENILDKNISETNLPDLEIDQNITTNPVYDINRVKPITKNYVERLSFNRIDLTSVNSSIHLFLNIDFQDINRMNQNINTQIQNNNKSYEQSSFQSSKANTEYPLSQENKYNNINDINSIDNYKLNQLNYSERNTRNNNNVNVDLLNNNYFNSNNSIENFKGSNLNDYRPQIQPDHKNINSNYSTPTTPSNPKCLMCQKEYQYKIGPVCQICLTTVIISNLKIRFGKFRQEAFYLYSANLEDEINEIFNQIIYEPFEIQNKKYEVKVLGEMVGIDISRFILQLKKDICIVCNREGMIQSSFKPICFPCDCCFCSKNCLIKYFKKIYEDQNKIKRRCKI